METTKLSTIFTAFNLGDRALKNRFIVAPMTRISASAQGVPTRGMQQYYTNFAMGGFAGVITEGVFTDELYSKSYAFQPGIVNDEQEAAWASIIRDVHAEDVLFICQLMHGGALSQCQRETLAPSSVAPLGQKMSAYGGTGAFPVPKAMERIDIENVIKGFYKLHSVQRTLDLMALRSMVPTGICWTSSLRIIPILGMMHTEVPLKINSE